MVIERSPASLAAVAAAVCMAVGVFSAGASARQAERAPVTPAASAPAPVSKALISKYCIGCHNE
ncbi:MAG: hypothetical protein ABIS29_10505, partial [Vicinamibacterales bacterium]